MPFRRIIPLDSVLGRLLFRVYDPDEALAITGEYVEVRDILPDFSVADSTALLNTTPLYAGQIVRQQRGGSYFIAQSTAMGDFQWLQFGPYTPPSSTEFATGQDYAVGDLAKVSPSDTIWECIISITNAVAGDAPGTGEQWIIWQVEDYHWTQRAEFGETDNRQVRLGPPDRADNWGPIFDHAYQQLKATTGGPGIVSEWGAEYVVHGSLHLQPGSYFSETPLKSIPGCSIVGAPGISHTVKSALAAHDNWDGSKYMIEGAYRNGTSATSNFFTSIENLLINCRGLPANGIKAAISTGSVLRNLDIDNFDNVGIHVVGGSDSWMAERIEFHKLQGGSVGETAWWFENGTIQGTVRQCAINRCEMALSFGNVKAMDVQAELENCGAAFEFRESGHADFEGSGSGYTGTPGGTRLHLQVRRNSADPYTTSTRVLGHVRHQGTQHHELQLSGHMECVPGGSCHDRITLENNNNPDVTYPLRWDRIENETWENFDIIPISTSQYLRNPHIANDNTTTLDGHRVAANNPGFQTVAGKTSFTLEAGLYVIRPAPSNNYALAWTMSLYQYPSGPAIPGISQSNSSEDRKYLHPGGQLELELHPPDSWVISTAYTAGQVRYHGASTYLCILNHTSSASDEPGVGGSWETYWTQTADPSLTLLCKPVLD